MPRSRRHRTKREMEKSRARRFEKQEKLLASWAARQRKAAKSARAGRRTANTRWRGPAIRDLVLASSRNLSAIGEALGVTRQAVGWWVAGRSEPGFGVGLRLAHYLRIDPWILDGWLQARRRDYIAMMKEKERESDA